MVHTDAMRPARGILLGGTLAGVLDILAAFLMSWPRVPPVRVLQYIASGALGPGGVPRRHRDGGSRASRSTFVIAFGAAAAYVAASRRWPLLLTRPVACGIAYGVVVYAVMQLVVLPLSRVTRGTPTWSSILTMVAIHIVCVGLPIALATQKVRRAKRAKRVNGRIEAERAKLQDLKSLKVFPPSILSFRPFRPLSFQLSQWLWPLLPSIWLRTSPPGHLVLWMLT